MIPSSAGAGFTFGAQTDRRVEPGELAPLGSFVDPFKVLTAVFALFFRAGLAVQANPTASSFRRRSAVSLLFGSTPVSTPVSG